MVQNIKNIATALVVTAGLVMAAAVPAHAIDVFPECGGDSSSTVCSARSDSLFGQNSIWSNILNALTFIIGAVSVLMIIIGGIRYVTSNGEQAQVTAAKNTILYAVIGLIVAVMAYAIVNFVLSNIF